MVLTRTPVTEPVVSIEPVRNAWNYPLFDAIFQRRARRFPARRDDAGRPRAVQVDEGTGAARRDRGGDAGDGRHGDQRHEPRRPSVQRPGRQQLVRQHYAPVRRPGLRQRLRFARHGAVLHERRRHLHGAAAGQDCRPPCRSSRRWTTARRSCRLSAPTRCRSATAASRCR